MYKKSITRTENETESSQADLSNPALQDIIATNHVVLAKKPHDGRLSRACKAVIIMIILGLVAIGIIVLTLVLAHSRNTLMAIVSRSAETNSFPTSNQSRYLFINQENRTKITNQKIENEDWQKTTVILTSNNLHTLTTQNVHISSSIMRTKQPNEHISSNIQSMKPYPSSNTIANEQSIISTTVETTFIPNIHHTTAENDLMTTMKSQEYIETSSSNPMTRVVDNTFIYTRDNSTSMPEETSFTTFISRHFNIQSSTITNHNEKKNNKLAKQLSKNMADEDVMDDIFLS